jgi:single-strand DNA-binding protein
MAGVNKVILIGNLGKDPEMRYTPSGQAVATFSLATTERRTDKTGQRKDLTEWHNLVAFGKTAELINQYLKKGRSCYIEGKIQTRSWDDKDGNKKYKTEILVNTVQFLGGAHPGASSGAQVAPSNDTAVAAGEENFEPMAPMPDAGPVGANDDLPF